MLTFPLPAGLKLEQETQSMITLLPPQILF